MNSMTRFNKKCPYCKSDKVFIDLNKMEIICKNCYTVLSQPYNYVAGRKVKQPLTRGYLKKEKKKYYKTLIPYNQVNGYKHTRNDKQLMILGHQDHYSKNLIKK